MITPLLSRLVGTVDVLRAEPEVKTVLLHDVGLGNNELGNMDALGENEPTGRGPRPLLPLLLSIITEAR